MLKCIVAATAAVAVVGSSVAYAQRLGGPDEDGGGSARFERHHRPSVDDIKAFADARIAALKAGLQLTPEQEKNWPAFEAAVRDLVKLRLERLQAREARLAAGEQQRPHNPFDRLQHRAEAMTERGAALKRLADAGTPLYNTLDDAQRHRFKVLAHLLRPHHHAHGWHRFGSVERDGGHWSRRGEGYGRDGQPGTEQFGREHRGFGEDDRGFGRFHRLMDSEDDSEQL